MDRIDEFTHTLRERHGLVVGPLESLRRAFLRPDVVVLFLSENSKERRKEGSDQCTTKNFLRN